MAKEDLRPFSKDDNRASEAGKKSSNKGIPHTKTRLKRILELESKLKNPITGEMETFTVAEQMDIAIIKRARDGDVRAYRAVLDRLEGMPTQTIDMAVEGSLFNDNTLTIEIVDPHIIEKISPEE
jgi:hypothetical protein